MTLLELAHVVGGRVYDAGEPTGPLVAGPAFSDSRSPESAGLFVALPGERVDGHDYAQEAIATGASAVLAARPVGVPAVVVDDPLTALGRLAHHVLEVLRRSGRPRVVAVTGSQGKTTTKDLLAAVLPAAGDTVATVGSQNNEIGVPLTVLRAQPSTRYLVLEMGSRGMGHLSSLCAIAPPDVSLVLNVGKAHLGEFGSQAEIALAKGEIVDALTEDGTAVLNADDPLVAAMAKRSRGAVRTYGARLDADLRMEGLLLDDAGRPRFDLAAGEDSAHVAMQLLGGHQAQNAAAAAAVALTLGLDLSTVAARLAAEAPASPWRMELHRRADGVRIINDAYNANPDSMRAALEALAVLGRGREGRTLAVLGEMLELGAASRTEHLAVGSLASQLGIDRLLVVGDGARPIRQGACQAGPPDTQTAYVPDAEQALGWLRENVVTGDVVLLKASRAAGLERVAQALLADEEDPDR